MSLIGVLAGGLIGLEHDAKNSKSNPYPFHCIVYSKDSKSNSYPLYCIVYNYI